jgi:class 3 adenylate cyclase/HAMP domain-containing protein
MSPEIRRGLSMRAKIIIAFCALSALVSLALGITTYEILNRNLLHELQNRVRTLAQTGSMLLDRDALRRLASAVRPGLPAERVTALEQSADFRKISDQLNSLRDTEKTLIRFVYTFVPTADENVALYLVDADVINDTAEGAEDISHLASEFDVTDFPVARQAMSERRVLVEPQYTHDEEFNVNSISGYAPVLAADGTPLAVLGLDMVDSDARRILRGVTQVSLVVAAAALAISIATSVALGTFFTAGIIHLDEVVRAFDVERNVDQRAEIRSRDEVGRLGLSFNQMADLIQRYAGDQKKLLEAAGRFVPYDFLRFLEKKSITDVKLGDQVAREMTVLFSDIQAFTELSEKIGPEKTFNFLASYLSRVGPVIRDHRGFIDKYIGDSIMGLFPEQPDDAVRAAVAMRAKLVEYNRDRANMKYQPISIGIGIHTGSMILGILGEERRVDGTVISDAVNLCSRVESLTRRYGSSVLVTGDTLSRMEKSRAFHTRFVDRVRVKGRSKTTLVYEVLDGDPLVEPKIGAKAEWDGAVQLYYDRQFAAAYKAFGEVRKRIPEDRVVDDYLRRCARLIKHGVPEGWDGVESFEAK